MTTRLLIGDCRDVLRTLPAASVHCVVTSPPYFGLRDYGVDGQIGLEPTPDAFVAEMVAIFREVKRVMRDDATLWLNLGDSYAGGGFCATAPSTATSKSGKYGTAGAAMKSVGNVVGLKPKDLIGIPWRVAFALQADGWYLRSDVIWSKPNPMPESATDRPTKAHEYMFLLSKRERYFYDAEAIREEAEYGRRDTAGAWRGGAYINQKGPQDNSNGTGLRNSVTGKHPEFGRNRRTVWTVATEPFSEAHFATFPPELIEPCIKAGCPEKCCAECGAPWVREVERIAMVIERSERTHELGRTRSSGTMVEPARAITTGFSPSCACNSATTRGTVLDPFGGAGTTGLVADRLQRNAILIELNPAYAGMAERRIQADRGPLLELMEAGA